MAEQNTVEIDNTELVEAIAAMRENFVPETQNKVINLTIKSSFYIPAMMSKSTELVQNAQKKLEFQEKPKAQFMLINHPEKGTFFPAFTDLDLLRDFIKEQQGSFRPFAMRFADLAAITEQTEQASGFIINPNRERLPYTKEMLAGIKNVLIKAKEAAANNKEPESSEGRPNITVTHNDNPVG
ncbi:MAG: SseB family protein [Ruminococcus sp.]|nr:SseB family protein [Ruminococcus sp.]